MQRLIIVGAGGFGREVHAWARDAWHFDCGPGDWEFGGFLDDNPAALERFSPPADSAWRVVGSPGTWTPSPQERFLIAVGSPKVKRLLAERLAARGARFATLVHPSARVGPRVTLGEGCILCPNVVLTCDIQLGRCVSLNISTAVGHDARVGDFVQASSFCDLTGGVHIGAGVFLGSRASVLPGVEVGEDATIGAGSVVIRRVRAGTTVFGSPARELHV